MRFAQEEYNRVFEKYDILIMPTIKYKAPKLPVGEMTVQGKNKECTNLVSFIIP